MSVFTDFARRELADKYNQSVFSLINYLSIRVAMTVKQSKSDRLNYEIELSDPKIHPMELKLFAQIEKLIGRMMKLEQDKHNPPMFSMATKKLQVHLAELLKKGLPEDPNTTSGDPDVQKSVGVYSSFSSMQGSNSIQLNFKSKTSLLSLQQNRTRSKDQEETPKILAASTNPTNPVFSVSSQRPDHRRMESNKSGFNGHSGKETSDPRREIHTIPEATASISKPGHKFKTTNQSKYQLTIDSTADNHGINSVQSRKIKSREKCRNQSSLGDSQPGESLQFSMGPPSQHATCAKPQRANYTSITAQNLIINISQGGANDLDKEYPGGKSPPKNVRFPKGEQSQESPLKSVKNASFRSSQLNLDQSEERRNLKTADQQFGRRKVNINQLIQKHNLQQSTDIAQSRILPAGPVGSAGGPNQFSYCTGKVYPKTIQIKAKTKIHSRDDRPTGAGGQTRNEGRKRYESHHHTLSHPHGQKQTHGRTATRGGTLRTIQPSKEIKSKALRAGNMSNLMKRSTPCEEGPSRLPQLSFEDTHNEFGGDQMASFTDRDLITKAGYQILSSEHEKSIQTEKSIVPRVLEPSNFEGSQLPPPFECEHRPQEINMFEPLEQQSTERSAWKKTSKITYSQKRYGSNPMTTKLRPMEVDVKPKMKKTQKAALGKKLRDIQSFYGQNPIAVKQQDLPVLTLADIVGHTPFEQEPQRDHKPQNSMTFDLRKTSQPEQFQDATVSPRRNWNPSFRLKPKRPKAQAKSKTLTNGFVVYPTNQRQAELLVRSAEESEEPNPLIRYEDSKDKDGSVQLGSYRPLDESQGDSLDQRI